MKHFTLILLLVILAALGGGFAWLGYADIPPPQEAKEITLRTSDFVE